MSLEELRARVLASMKKKEEAELEEGEVPAPPPPPPSAPASAPPLPQNPPPPPPPMNAYDERFVGERERTRTRSPSYTDPTWRTSYPKHLDDAWETDDQPYYEPRDYRGRSSRGRGAGPRGRGRGAGWPKPVLARHERDRDNRAAPTQDAGAAPVPQLSLEEMTQLILLLRQQPQLPQQQLPSTAIPSTLAAYGSYHPDVPAYDASVSANDYYHTEANATDLTLGGIHLNMQGAEAFVRLAALLQQPQDNGAPTPPLQDAQPAPEPSATQPEGSNHGAPLTAEDAASKFLSLLSMQLPMQGGGGGGGGGGGVELAPATAAPTSEMPEAEADMEVEPAQTPGRIILANPQPTAAPAAPTAPAAAAAAAAAPAAPAPPKPQPRVLSVKAPTPPKAAAAPVKPQPVRATTPPSEAKPRAPPPLAPAAAATAPPITRNTVQRPPSTRTAPSESSLVILLDSASEDEAMSDTNTASAASSSSSASASSLTAPLPASLTATNAPASSAPVRSVALKSSAVPAAKAAAKAAEAQSEIERLRQLIAQKERELAKKRPVEEEATASKKVKSTPAPAAGSAPASAAVPPVARAPSPVPGASPTSPPAPAPPSSTLVPPLPAPQQGTTKVDVAPMDVSSSVQEIAAPASLPAAQPSLLAPSRATPPVAAISVASQPPAAQVQTPAARASSALAAPARSSSPSTLSPRAAPVVPPPSAASARPAAAPEPKSAPPQPAAARTPTPLAPTPANPAPTPASTPSSAPTNAAPAAQGNEDAATSKPDLTRSRFIMHLIAPALADAKKTREEMLAAAREVEALEAQAKAATQEAARTQAQARLASARTVAAEKREATRRLDVQLIDLLFELRLSAGLRALRVNQELPIHANVAEFLRPYLSQMPPILPSPVAPALAAAAAAAATPAHASAGTASSSNSAPAASAPSPTPTPPAPTAKATTPGEQEAKRTQEPRNAPSDSTQPPHFPAVSAAELVVELAADDPCSGVLDIALSPFAALNRWSEERAARDEAEERQLSSSRSSLSRSSHVAPLMHATALPADYRSPLLALRAYRLQSIFPAKRTSATHSVRPDPRVKLCRFELSGACNDPACAYQHLRDILLVGGALATDYASYAPVFASKSDAAPVTAESVVAAARATLSPKQKGDTEALVEAVLAQLYTLRTDHRLLLLPRPPYEMPRKTKKRAPKSHVEAAPDEESEEEELKAARPDSEGFMTLAHTAGAAIKERHSTRAADEGRYWMPAIATADYESMLQAAPNDVGLWLRFAKGCGATDDGLRALARALEHNKTSTELWLAYLRLFLRLRCWQPEAAQLALNATRFNARDVLLARLAAQLARTVSAAVAILTTAAKALATAHESENRAMLLLTGAEALLSQGSVFAAQDLLAAAALSTPLRDAVAGEDALCAAAAPLAQHESVLLLLCACHVSLYGRMPVFPSGAPTLFRVPWLPTTSALAVSWIYVAVADARLSGGESAAASALWANAVSLHRALGNAQRASALAAEATAAAPRVTSRWVLRAKQEEQDGALDAALSVLDDAAQADPEHSVAYTLHSCVMRVQHGAQQPADAAKHLAACVMSLSPSEDARSAFLRVLALDADLAPVSLPASSDPLVWLSFALFEALREGAETEQVRAVFARALAQLRTDSARRLVQREYLCWVASRPKINGRMVLAELERIEVERDGLTLAVHFVATAATRLSATDALALFERVAAALGEGSAVAMLALRCLDGGLQPPEMERVRQLVSNAATVCSFDTTLWLALVRCAALYRKESLLLQTRAAMERAHPRFVALLDQLDARATK